ncbi:MAG: hypothetical protein IJ174_09285 [Clostridia bacterium]|nr:hypothetical protein [Clostridia bacterium]
MFLQSLVFLPVRVSFRLFLMGQAVFLLPVSLIFAMEQMEEGVMPAYVEKSPPERSTAKDQKNRASTAVFGIGSPAVFTGYA